MGFLRATGNGRARRLVARTFGWWGRYRRLNRDYEREAQIGELMVHLAMIRLMVARLTRP